MASYYFLTPEQWDAVQIRIQELEAQLSVSIADHYVRAKLQKEHTSLLDAFVKKSSLETYDTDIAKLEADLQETSDNEMISLMKDEIEELQKNKLACVRELEEILYPADVENDRSVFLEIRAGTGGLEASLFASEIAKTYTLYAQKNNWDISIASCAETDVGGYREIILHIEGKKVYEKLRHEAGVHRVQRVPTTETSGRVHTSTITIAVIPEAEEVEVSIDPSDLRIDTYRASGAGGQHVNKTDSAIRITHIPTNIVVTCQDERSQHKNRIRALKILKSRILASEKEKQEKELSKMRKEMVSTGERSEKVRTYNFPQNRISDHQVEITLNRLDYFLMGNLDEIITALINKARAERSTNQHFLPFLKIKSEN